ncbi:hypothetical protein P053_02864, partial [Brucella abortus 01-4165]
MAGTQKTGYEVLFFWGIEHFQQKCETVLCRIMR